MAASVNDLLKATARSFYLTVRAMPPCVQPQIGLAYLLARTTDTVADTQIIPAQRRLEALQDLCDRILGRRSTPLQFAELAREQASSAEKTLLEQAETSIAALQAFSREDQQLIRDVLATITSGQKLDLQRFENASHSQVKTLNSSEELDDYTYRVAGCVGEFLVKVCQAHLFPKAKLDRAQLVADGIRFGKGLQLVNILRDLPADLKNGRCYLPLDKLKSAGLQPETLLDTSTEAAFLSLFHEHLTLAEGHLAAGWRYVNTLPFGQFRLRLACAWLALLGKKTINRMRTAGVIELKQRVKVPRREVYLLMLQSTLASPIPFVWKRLY